jgi:hypothetical protein
VAGRLPAALPLSRRLLRGSLNVPFDSARPDALLRASRDRGRGGHRRLAGATFAELSANSPWCWR